MVQLGTTEDEATVFRAHAVPQGLCENLINRDGDSPIQNIFTGLRERCREGTMNGLRSFIDLDNHRAVEVATCAEAYGLSRSNNRKKVKIIQRF